MTERRVAMIAGEGGLPRALGTAMGRAGVRWSACHLAGHVPKGVGQSRGFRIEQFGSFLNALRDEGVTDVVLAGAVARPQIDPNRLDAATAPMAERLAEAVASGDDAALRTVVALIEEAGLRVVSAADVAPDLTTLPDAGPDAPTPSDRDHADVERGRAVLDALAPVDVGQACVVAAGQVLAVEALPGTDWMLASLATAPRAPVPRPPVPRPPQGRVPQPQPSGGGLFGGLTDWLSGPGAAHDMPDFARPDGGVMVKMPKAGQDLRVDMPAIGPDTVRRAATAGLSGIAVQRGAVLVLEAEEVGQIARGTGLFLHEFG